MYKILEKQVLSAVTKLMVIEAPHVARAMSGSDAKHLFAASAEQVVSGHNPIPSGRRRRQRAQSGSPSEAHRRSYARRARMFSRT